ncbi:MAG: DNA polymerase III subunit beta [Deltaproteobacteria bacterium]|nr:MAG: DNA polymerase III subunit beta [Deltaproteobacteria bacterium]
MDLFIDRDALARGLARVQGIVERRGTHPVLSHVLLRARDGSLRVTATDTEVAYIGDIAANVEKAGEIAVDAAHFFQVIRTLPDPTVRLTLGGSSRLEVTSGRAFFRLPGTAAEEYPSLPAFDARGAVTVVERELLRLVEQTSFAVSTDDGRSGFNGADIKQIETESGPRMRFIATNGHRLAVASSDYEGDLAVTPRMLVPRKALAVMKKLLDSEDSSVELAFGDGAMRLTRGGETFWFRMLDGDFPAWEQLPRGGKQNAIVLKEELTSTLRRVAILVQDKVRAVKFAFTDDELQIQVHNVDRGEVKEALPIEFEGEPITIGFNVKYLAEMVGALRGDKVKLSMAHPLGPCEVSDPDSDDAFFIIMPMRLD